MASQHNLRRLSQNFHEIFEDDDSGDENDVSTNFIFCYENFE
jgi:hypothetical protein